MFKKFLKKTVVLASVCAMGLSLVACGDKEEETTTEARTEAPTEAITEAPVVNETSDPVVDDNGNLTFNGLTINIPEGFEYSDADSSSMSVTFVDSANSSALVIGVDNNNTMYNESNVVEIFDAQIKVPYGDAVTYSSVNYNGHAATEWVLDNEEGGYAGRSLVVCDGSMMIYIEYVSYTGNIDAYTAAVSTIAY